MAWNPIIERNFGHLLSSNDLKELDDLVEDIRLSAYNEGFNEGYNNALENME